MTKEDRYAHLGDGIEETTDTSDAGADRDDETPDRAAELTVTLDDGAEETVLTFDREEVSADEIRAAIESASEGGDTEDGPTPLLSGDPRRLALELGTLGPRIALKSVESLVDGLQVDRKRDRD